MNRTIMTSDEQLAASQALEQQLREALASEHADHVSLASSELGIDPWECEALALPSDDTALQARLKEEREKCAVKCEQHGQTLGSILAAAIRSMT